MSNADKLLNSQQRKAVEHGEGSLLIIAGAGTGKTTVITERIKYLITEKNIKPSQILALTFTEKAAREMEERVDQALPYGYTQMWISTFHSFCDRILRTHAIHIGLNPAYRLLSDTDATMLLRKELFNLNLEYFRPLGNPNKFIGGMLTHFSRLKDEDVMPTQYLAWVKSQILLRQAQDKQNPKSQNEEETLEIKKYEELARVYKQYEELKTKEGVMDFGDLISNTLTLFRKRPNVLAQFRSQFSFILIDEFQDTNVAQYEVIKLLAPAKEKPNITVVGDDNQCLPPDAKIATVGGEVFIKDIRKRDEVISAVGKGYLSTEKVVAVKKEKKTARFLTFKTESGEQVTVTDNHQMFCMIPGKKFGTRRFYVYLMQQRAIGWRLGITDDLAHRLRLEIGADRIIAIASFDDETKARFYEMAYSLQYGIPTYPFKPRKGMSLTGPWLTKLFTVIDSAAGAQRLASDLGINLNTHHFALGGVVRGQSERIKVLLTMCTRKYATQWGNNRLLISPKVLHEVHLETSSKNIIQKLTAANIKLTSAKKGIRLRRTFADLTHATNFAQQLVEITGGIFEARFVVGKRNKSARPALIMPAANIIVGMDIPVKKGFSIVYERVVERTQKIKLETVYDLEIENTHNFIANNVVVHNSIYKFRGAAVSNILSFKKDYPSALQVVLNQNYRSYQYILDTSYKLIKHNDPDTLEATLGISKKLVSTRGNMPGQNV